MNDRDERIIAGLAEVKAELVALAVHVEKQNGAIVKHFADDLTVQSSIVAWQTGHDLRVQTREAQQAGYRAGLRQPWVIIFGGLMLVGGLLGPTIESLLLGG